MVKDVMTLHILFLQKHVKDLTSKMYKRYLDKFDLKLLTKLPKKGFVPVLGGEISVNHAPIDINLRLTYVYCISSLTHPMIKRHLNISMKLIQVLKISC